MKKIFFMLLALLPSLMMADNVSEERAESIAKRFFSSNVKTRSEAPSLRMVWNGESMTTRSESFPAFYVFNNESGKGFVIVSGDDCTSTPILGYSFDQNFSAENMPQNISAWMGGIRSEINEARANHVAARADNHDWAKFEVNDMKPIKVLETALWDQRDPYNSELPVGYVTGCPATAIAIVMRYHSWPEKGVGTIPQSNEAVGDVTLGHTYDWANMPMKYTDAATPDQRKQVGILMRDVGAMVRTQYSAGTAGANPEETLPQLMPIYMRYDRSTIRSIMKKDFSDTEWHALMQKEIDENRPVLYGGYSSGGGHQFVLDGYAADNYYHINWGWSGISNGYYLLTTMNPPEQGAGGSISADGFTKKQDAIIGIQPDAQNPGGGHFDLYVYKPYYENKPYGMITAETSFEQGAEFKLDLKEFQNKGSREFAGQIAIAHYADDGTLKEIVSHKTIDYSVYTQQINDFTEGYFTCTINKPIENGDYLCGVFKYQNPSDWTPIHNGYLENDNCIEKIMLEGGDEPVPPVSKTKLEIAVGEGGHVTCDGKKIEGVQTIEVESNRTFEILICPDEGYELSSLLFNDTEVSSEVKEGVYTTPVISAASAISVVFGKVSGIDDAEYSPVKVSAGNGILTVEGAEAGSQIDIYTLTGAKVKSVKATSDSVNIAIGHAVYVVRVAGRIFKVVM